MKRSIRLVFAALASVAVLAGTACNRGDDSGQSADSTARDLTLAPAESTAAMRDVPATPPAAPPRTAPP
ncbi:MAG: hypothetical protein Q8Q14_16590, partial [Gemmatimonadales bacterium]|nr:hypothetical protein [Gemmatimonadales bacterium]